MPERVSVYEVTGLGPLRTRLQRAVGHGLTKLVGREVELAQMRRALESAHAGHGQLVAATGEPGAGKSRLFFEFRAVAQSGCRVLEAYSVSHGKASAYRGSPSEAPFDVLSPVSGGVFRVTQESEGPVTLGASIVEVADPADLEVVVDVLSTDAVQIKPGAEVILERWGGPPLVGRVRVVEPSAFTKISALGVEEQRVNVIIDFTSPREQWNTLGDGFKVDARIAVYEKDDAVRFPSARCFDAMGSGRFIWWRAGALICAISASGTAPRPKPRSLRASGPGSRW